MRHTVIEDHGYPLISVGYLSDGARPRRSIRVLRDFAECVVIGLIVFFIFVVASAR